jgi:hypothetical protein
MVKTKFFLAIALGSILTLAGCAPSNSDSSVSESLSSADLNPTSFKVTFLNYNDSPLGTVEVKQGETASFNGVNPTRPDEDAYYYVFTGWDKKLTDVQTNFATHATYDRFEQTFLVTFLDEDGVTKLGTSEVKYGATATFTGEVPQKEQTVDKVYTFDHWDGALTNVTHDLSVKAVYVEKTRQYTVTFYDEDGTTQLWAKAFDYGTDAVYAGPTPTKASDDQYSYAFDSWEGDLTNIRANRSVSAIYAKTTRTYTVTFLDDSGNTFSRTNNVPYGTAAKAPTSQPTKASDTNYTYTFSSWKEDFSFVTSDLVIHPLFSQDYRLYSVFFHDTDGSIITAATEHLKYGEIPAFSASLALPKKTSTEGEDFTFTGWSNSGAISGDTNLYPQFASSIRKYTITLKNYDGAEIISDQCEYGKLFTSSKTFETPTKPSTLDYTYAFKGWKDSEGNAVDLSEYIVKGDATLTAVFKANTHYFKANFLDADGLILQRYVDLVNGSSITYTGQEPLSKTLSAAGVSNVFDHWDDGNGNSFALHVSTKINASWNPEVDEVNIKPVYAASTYAVTYTAHAATETTPAYASISKIAGDLGTGATFLSSYTDGGVTYPVTAIDDLAGQGIGKATTLVIPKTIATIGTQAFSGVKITNLTFEEGSVLTSIGISAFSGADIASLSLPKGLLTLGSSAFQDCRHLSSVYLPASLTSIGAYAFVNDTALKKLSYENMDGMNLSYGSNVFTNCGFQEVTFVAADHSSAMGYLFSQCQSLTKITLHCSAAQTSPVINHSLCEEDTALTEVVFDSSFSAPTIPEECFRGCTALTSITLPASITTIGYSAFCGCTHLATCVLPASLTTINYAYPGYANYAEPFVGCEALTVFTAPNEGLTNFEIIDGVLFSKDGTTLALYPYGKSEEAYAIPEGVTAIAQDGWGNAWEKNPHLKTLSLPSSFTAIGSDALSNLSALTTVTMVNAANILSIGDSAFSEDTQLTNFVIPEGVTAIGQNAFTGCSHLASVTLPSSLLSLGTYAFENCTALTSITLPASLTTFDRGVFSGCTALTEIKVEAGNTAFKSVDGILYSADGKQLLAYPAGKDLTSFTTPSDLEAISDSAFYGNTHLTTLTISANVATIGFEAFSHCSALSSLTFSAAIPDNLGVFPASSLVTIGGVAFADTALTSVVLPAGVTTMGTEVFYGCSALTEVYLVDTASSWNNAGWNVNWRRRSNNGSITDVNYALYSATTPTDTSYTYWHYVSEVPTLY